MRILVVLETDWIEKGPHQHHHLIERMTTRGHEVRVIDFEILWKNHSKREIVSKRTIYQDVHKAIPDGKVIVIRPSIVRLSPFDYLSILVTYRREIKKQINEFKPDVIIGFGILNCSIAMRFARKSGLPFVDYVIDENYRLVPQKGFRGVAKLIESANLSRSDLVISINEALRQYTISMGTPKERTLVIRAGIDPERFNLKIDCKAARQRLHIAEKDIVLFFMGWLYEFSGLKELTDEFRKNLLKYDNIKLLIVGKGELWNYLKEAAEKDLKERMILLSWQPYEEIPSLIAASDICILPAYKNEIMQNIVPIKMYEYMAMGKPVIATNLKGLKMEFGEGNGVIYIDKSEEAFNLAIKLSHDDRILQEGSKARLFVGNNYWGGITTQFENALKNIILENQKRNYASK